MHKLTIGQSDCIWLTTERLVKHVYNCCDIGLPVEVLMLVAEYTDVNPPVISRLPLNMFNRPPTYPVLTRRIKNDRRQFYDYVNNDYDYSNLSLWRRVPKESSPTDTDLHEWLSTLIGSSVYLLHRRRGPGGRSGVVPVVRSPLLVVWSIIHNKSTYLGLVWPTVKYDKDSQSLVFGPPQVADVPITGCCLVFYDIDIAKGTHQAPNLDDTICRLQANNLANSLKRLKTRQETKYPVWCAQINRILRPSNHTPFQKCVHTISLIAPVSHPSWPWNSIS
jgi:hypothetical protein